MREIRIRELRADEARRKLEMELNDAFMAGETSAVVLHGIGSGRLKKLTEEVVQEMGFARILPALTLSANPGETRLELLPPDKKTLRMLKGKG